MDIFAPHKPGTWWNSVTLLLFSSLCISSAMDPNYTTCCFAWVCNFNSNSKTAKIASILMMRIFIPKRDEATRESRKLENKQFYSLYLLPNTVWMMMSRVVRWAGSVTHVGEMGNAYKLFTAKHQGRSGHWYENIKIYHTKIQCKDICSVQLAQHMFYSIFLWTQQWTFRFHRRSDTQTDTCILNSVYHHSNSWGKALKSTQAYTYNLREHAECTFFQNRSWCICTLEKKLKKFRPLVVSIFIN